MHRFDRGRSEARVRSGLTAVTIALVAAASAFVSSCAAIGSLTRPTFIEITPSHARATAPLVVWVSGDGGWGRLEQEVSKRLVSDGAPVIGVNTLRYFAQMRRPQAAALDIAAAIYRFDAVGSRREIVFVGFSFGADIGPYIVHDMPPDIRTRIRLAAFLSPSEKANLRVSPASWLGIGIGQRVWPALSTLAPTPVLCLGGVGVFRDICPADTHTATFTSVRVAGGHQLSGHYDLIARLLLADPGTLNSPP